MTKFEKLITIKQKENKITTKNITHELGITFVTYKKRIKKELITLADIMVLKRMLCISNQEIASVFN